jgi:hypothetical protein
MTTVAGRDDSRRKRGLGRVIGRLSSISMARSVLLTATMNPRRRGTDQPEQLPHWHSEVAPLGVSTSRRSIGAEQRRSYRGRGADTTITAGRGTRPPRRCSV